jgi:AraC family transcriptional regulator of adaptative response / DNA-3-methyladenine glycosylase II
MNQEAYYQAMLARDYRFDGKFFVGVKTTGIYCRPICPAKPKRGNVEFFSHATAAEKAGYRPCLRCRPECAPLSPAWYGKSAIVQRALKVMAVTTPCELSEDKFAMQFGVSARHLRRLFNEEVGRTPTQIMHAGRLNFARQLIVETDLPVTVVAMTAGFSSLRRFNDAFKKRFHRAPSPLRKRREEHGGEKGIRLALSYRPPFHWQGLLAFYRSHQIMGVERVTESAYERVFRIGQTVSHMQVRHHGTEPKLEVQVVTADPTVLFAVAQRVRAMFDLDSDPLLVNNSFRSHRFLHSLCVKYPGLRLARGWDPFETAICTILGQLISVRQARNLIQQLVQHYGEKVTHPLTGGEASLFPKPESLVHADLGEVKTTQARKASLRQLAGLVAEGRLNLITPQSADEMRELLLSIPGIGPWSAEYISLRALGSTDAFPGTDLILKRAMEKHRDLDLERIRPWRSYAAVYLWKHYAETLSKKGAIK